jgi:DNA-binding MarR family transcriptional regulator
VTATQDDRQERQDPPDPRQDAANDAWRALGDLTGLLRTRVLSAANGLDLTPGESRALDALEPDRPRPMRALAETLCCDASNVTWLVDRLEARGFVERRPSLTDRRVKAVTLTAAGIEARTRLLAAIDAPPAFLAELPAADLAELTRLVGLIADAARRNTEAPAGGSAS